MNNISVAQQSRSEQKKRTVTSLLLGIISITPEVIYIGNWSWYFNMELWLRYLERFWFIFFPLAIICGMVGIRIGMKNLKLVKIPILIKILSTLGIILSGLGMTSALLVLVFGLYTAGF